MRAFTLTTATVLLAGIFFVGTAEAEQRQKEEMQVQVSAEQLNPEQIRALQHSLKDHGIDPGPTDGKLGPLTRQGILVFQQRQGLATTGHLNEQTIEALGMEPREFLGTAPSMEQRQARQQTGMQEEARLEISLNQLNSAQVRKLQQELKNHGIDPGPADGVMGPLTQQGLQVYQQQEGLEPTGNLNERTLNALDIETEEFMGLAPAFK